MSSSSMDEVPLAERSVLVTILSNKKPISVAFDLKAHPEWTKMEDTFLGVKIRVDTDAIQMSLENGDFPELPLLSDASVLSTAEDHRKVLRAQTSRIAKAGYNIDTAEAAEIIADAFRDGTAQVLIGAEYSDPTVTMPLSDGTAKTWTLLATGYSDFSNSTPGRFHNVHKVIEEHVHNVVVRKDGEFNLVDTIDNPITEAKGWKIDTGLFGGGAAPTVGAGICQSATTLFRAALFTGLPIVEKRNHSLFVDHYEYFGIGLDATVFPGVRNLRFKNDTPDDILLQAYTQGDTVILNVYGKDDGRSVHMAGPYFAGSKNRHKALVPLSKYQIGWVRTITYGDGSEKVEPVISTFAKPVWNSIVRKYDGHNGMELIVKKQPSEESIW